MNRIDRLGSLVGLLLAGVVIWQSVIIPMGTLNKPGPGFLPFWAGVILALLAGLLWLGSEKRKPFSAPLKIFPEEGRWSSVIWAAGSLLAYGFALEVLGFIFCTAALMLFLFYFIGQQKWWVALTGSVLVTWVAHALFKLVLKVQLPAGIFRI